MLILTSKILETTTVPVNANPCLGVFSSCLVKTLHKARGEKQGSGRHQRWTLLSCVSKQQKTSETEIVGRCIRSADDQKTDSVVRCIRSADDQKTDSIVRCIRSADDQKDGQCCQVYQISRRPLRRTVLSGVSDQQTTRKMDSIVRCIRSADDQKTDSVVRCIRSADDKKDGQCCQVYQISRRPERQTVLSGVSDHQMTRKQTVLSGVSDHQMTRRMDSVVRCIRSADDQKDNVVRCIRSADDKKGGQCCQLCVVGLQRGAETAGVSGTLPAPQNQDPCAG